MGTQNFFKKESESEKDKHCWSGRAPWTLFMLMETLWILITETFQKKIIPLYNSILL